MKMMCCKNIHKTRIYVNKKKGKFDVYARFSKKFGGGSGSRGNSIQRRERGFSGTGVRAAEAGCGAGLEKNRRLSE
ncbi:hypothetical protein [Treponema sp.]|uniref:hypothetical protein n=1 Tax=Treponema sp. TaxID=166 RepID=UPI00388F9734